MIENVSAPMKLTNRSSIVSSRPMSRYPPSPSAVWVPSACTTMTSVMFFSTVDVLPPVGSSIMEPIVLTTVSFCISRKNSWSIVHSKNSQTTPTVIEKQNATMARYSGDRWNRASLWRFRMSSSENPMAAHKKPFSV